MQLNKEKLNFPVWPIFFDAGADVDLSQSFELSEYQSN